MQLIADFEEYIFANLGLVVNADRWQITTSLPLYFQTRFSFYQCELLGQKLLLLVPQDSSRVETPGAVKKVIQGLEDTWDGEVVFVCDSMAAYVRQRFIGQKISFTVPGNQMYLPLFGMDLREHMRRVRLPEVKKFSPAAQVVMLFALYNWKVDGFTPTFLAQKLGYSTMTLSRVFSEFQSCGIGEVKKEGRKRILCFTQERGTVWERALPLMKSPVKQRVEVELKGQEDVAVAGLSALSRYGMSISLDTPVFAVGKKEWKPLGLRSFNPVTHNHPAQVEIWHYSPFLFVRKNVVDPLSLYLSLDENKAEHEGVESEDQLLKFRKYIGQVMRKNGGDKS